MENRKYQVEAIEAGMGTDNGVEVLPTGSGKSVVIAGLVDKMQGGTMVLQPSVEILESNVDKIRLLGITPAVYSASAGSKQVGDVTYATIGSVIDKLELFKHVRNIVIDEAHLVNAKGGMYEQLIQKMQPERLLGLTATPYRLASSSYGSSMRIIVRTRPKLFERIVHVTNPRDLIPQGFLMDPEFIVVKADSSMLRQNTTGAEFSAGSIRDFSRKNKIRERIVDLIKNIDDPNVLAFAESVDDSKWAVEQLNAAGITASEVNAETDKKIRRRDLEKFQESEIRVMVNVGTLTTGYDFPGLCSVVDGNPTMSAALHYQKIGRVVRPFPGKKPKVYCLAGNYERLGNPLYYTMMKNSSGLYEVYGQKGRITTWMLSNGPESDSIITFGKYRDRKLSETDDGWLAWAVTEFKGEKKHMFHSEITRRSLFGAA